MTNISASEVAAVKYTFENVLFKYHSRTKSGLGSKVEAILNAKPQRGGVQAQELLRSDDHPAERDRSADPAQAHLQAHLHVKVVVLTP